jgi:hypothetical protein
MTRHRMKYMCVYIYCLNMLYYYIHMIYISYIYILRKVYIYTYVCVIIYNIQLYTYVCVCAIRHVRFVWVHICSYVAHITYVYAFLQAVGCDVRELAVLFLLPVGFSKGDHCAQLGDVSL